MCGLIHQIVGGWRLPIIPLCPIPQAFRVSVLKRQKILSSLLLGREKVHRVLGGRIAVSWNG
jgi:hypothetical protein